MKFGDVGSCVVKGGGGGGGGGVGCGGGGVVVIDSWKPDCWCHYLIHIPQGKPQYPTLCLPSNIVWFISL